MPVALYARVSTRRQNRDQTIESQLTAIRQWAGEQGHVIPPELVFTDDGYSGSRLDRPALDRLRDAVHEGAVDTVAVHSPDRLARRYAYQVVLLEEFRKAGCAVIFIHRPISADPHDQLLLQIQGAVAEYERAVLGERFRRGKLQKARSGQWVAGKSPYGYRYIPKREGVAGHLVVDEDEAAVVRMLYRWLIDERTSVRQILKRLANGPWRPRSGKRFWSSSVVHRVLSDPVYTGTGYANRHTFVVPRKPRLKGPRAGERTCRQPRPESEWIPIPVPAIIDGATHRQAAEQLARNSVLSFRHNTRNQYLLRCLLTCKTCGRALHGVTYRNRNASHMQAFYKCRGKEGIVQDPERRCHQNSTRMKDLDAAVWDHVVRLLEDPATLLAQFRSIADAAPPDAGVDSAGQLRRLDREEQRLVDAYQSEVITLADLKARRAALETRRQALRAQQDQLERLQAERQTAQSVGRDLTRFCERIRTRLKKATVAEKQEVLQLLIERIIVGDDTLEIRHVIPLRGRGDPQSPQAGQPPEPQPNDEDNEDETKPETPRARLRSDDVGPAAEVPDAGAVDRVVAAVAVGVDEAGVALQERGRILIAATGGEVEECVGMGRVAEVEPGIRGAVGLQKLDRTVVRVDRERLFHPRDHGSINGIQQDRTLPDQIAQAGAAHGPAQAGEDCFLPVERQVIDVLRDDDLGEQSGPDARLRHRFRQDRGFGELRVAGRPLAGAAGISRLRDLADEDCRGGVVEPFADRLADADPHRGAAGADLFGLAEVQLFASAGQVRRVRLATVALALRRRLGG